MKVSLNQELTIEFDEDSLSTAAVEFGRLKRDFSSEILDSLFIILAFRHIETANPGTIARLEKQVAKEAKK